VSVAYLHDDEDDVEIDDVQKKRVDQDVEFCTTMKMELKQDGLDHKRQTTSQVLDTFR